MSNIRYNFESSEPDSSRAKIMYVSRSKYEADWHSVPHFHNFSELFYVLHGSGKFLIEDECFSVKKNDLIIVNPNIEHTEESDSFYPLEYIAIGVDGLVFSFHDSQNLNYQIISDTDKQTEMLYYFNALLEEIEFKKYNYEVVCQNLLDVLIIKLMRHTGYSFSVLTEKTMNKQYAVIKRYIDTYFAENITLESLAKLAHINKFYLVHIFTNAAGISPINYLQEKRISEGKHMLETTNYSISQISNLTGFSSQSYFSQIFKKETNMTPNSYRKMTRHVER